MRGETDLLRRAGIREFLTQNGQSRNRTIVGLGVAIGFSLGESLSSDVSPRSRRCGVSNRCQACVLQLPACHEHDATRHPGPVTPR